MSGNKAHELGNLVSNHVVTKIEWVLHAHARWHRPEIVGSFSLISADIRLLLYFPVFGGSEFFGGNRSLLLRVATGVENSGDGKTYQKTPPQKPFLSAPPI